MPFSGLRVRGERGEKHQVGAGTEGDTRVVRLNLALADDAGGGAPEVQATGCSAMAAASARWNHVWVGTETGILKGEYLSCLWESAGIACLSPQRD